MDNIKIIIPLPSTKGVKPVDRRQNNNQQNPFKETFKERQKKKKKTKDHPVHVKLSGGGVTAGEARHTRPAVTNKNPKKSIGKRIIDIRV